jgi:hypothetical protein
MSRFMVFAGLNYYPSGGMNDFVSSHETLEDAITAVQKLRRADWWHIFDLQADETVMSSRR